MSNLINTLVVAATVHQHHSDCGAEDAMETDRFDAEVQASIDDPDPGLPHDEAMLQVWAAVFAD